MKLVILSEKQIGKRLKLPIYSESGVIFIKEGFVLTEYVISKVKAMGITSAYVDEEEEDGDMLQEVLESPIKIKIMNELKKCYEEIIKTKNIDETKIKQIVKLLLENIQLSSHSIMINNFAREGKLAEIALHSIEVAIYSLKIGIHRQYNGKKIEDLLMSAFLHDIGKLFTDKKNHMQLAYELVKRNKAFGATVFVPILHIHEKIDGSGVIKIEGDKLYEGSQVLHIANNFANLQKEEMMPHEMIERLSGDAASKFEMSLFQDSMKAFDCYPNGLPVILSTGVSGVVVRQNVGIPTRPIIRVVHEGKKEEIDLKQALNIFISKIDY